LIALLILPTNMKETKDSPATEVIVDEVEFHNDGNGNDVILRNEHKSWSHRPMSLDFIMEYCSEVFAIML
jgi:hypothetical protein